MSDKSVIFVVLNFKITMTKRSKKWLWIIAAVLLAGIAAAWWAFRPSDKIPTVSNGRIERFAQFDSEYVTPRTVLVWLPAGYQTGDSVDVLYMHDGQMLFDSSITWNGQEWQVDEISSQLMSDSAMRRCIVVGIENTSERLKEYFPTKIWHHLPVDVRGQVDVDDLLGDDYLQFVVEEVKPFIDKRYHPLTSREHTFMMGSSMGGLISLYALCEYPQVFGGVACLSTHLSFDHLDYGTTSDQWAEAFRQYVSRQLPPYGGHMVYMDHGTEGLDGEYAEHQERLDSVFKAQGWDRKHYLSRVFEGHEHKEIFWSKRLEQPLLFLLGK